MPGMPGMPCRPCGFPAGTPNWCTAHIRCTRRGGTVFHYSRPARASCQSIRHIRARTVLALHIYLHKGGIVPGGKVRYYYPYCTVTVLYIPLPNRLLIHAYRRASILYTYTSDLHTSLHTYIHTYIHTYSTPEPPRCNNVHAQGR
jgi:hypothetical protein